MSVILLPYAHINVLAHEVTRWGAHLLARPSVFGEALASMGVDARKPSAEAVGSVLVRAIGQSYLARYMVSVDELAQVQDYIDAYRFTHPRRAYSTAEVAMALQSFSYQACEASDWEQSAGHCFVGLMQRHLLGCLVRESGADTWVIEEEAASRV